MRITRISFVSFAVPASLAVSLIAGLLVAWCLDCGRIHRIAPPRRLQGFRFPRGVSTSRSVRPDAYVRSSSGPTVFFPFYGMRSRSRLCHVGDDRRLSADDYRRSDVAPPIWIDDSSGEAEHLLYHIWFFG